MKKLICCLLVISMLFAMSTSAFAGEVGTVNGDNAYSEEGCIIDMTEVKEMPKSDLILYEKYKVREGDLEQKNAYALQKDNVVENVLSLCVKKTSEKVADKTITTYELHNYEDLLKYCQKLIDVSTIDNTMYIQYISKDNKEVILSYNRQGVQEISVYDSSNDTLAYMGHGQNLYYTNFRKGTIYYMSDEKLKKIEQSIYGGRDSLCDIEEIMVIDLPNGTRLIEEKLPQAQETNPASTTSNTTYKGFKSESEMLKDLKNHFPFIDTKKSYIRHSPYLNEDLNVQIQTVRNDYVKVSANYKSFKAQTAITIISAFLGGWATTQITVKILTVLGVGISTADLITTAVTLYKASEYNFFGAKYARVFDRLTHNAYVNVKRYTGKGKYAGEYNSAGEFHWVNSIVCEALNKNEATLATEAGTLYNNAVQQNGYCTYYPNSW